MESCKAQQPYLEVPKVGSRDFRKQLARFLDSTDVIAVSCKGEVRGYYIPAALDAGAADRAALKRAVDRWEAVHSSGYSQDPKAIRDDRAQTDEVAKLVQMLRGGREPEPNLLRSLYSAADSRHAPASSLINRLQQMVERGRVLTEGEILAQVKQGLGL